MSNLHRGYTLLDVAGKLLRRCILAILLCKRVSYSNNNGQDENLTLPDVLNTAKNATLSTDYFWTIDKKIIHSHPENVLLVYFFDLSKLMKSSTLSSVYSM